MIDFQVSTIQWVYINKKAVVIMRIRYLVAMVAAATLIWEGLRPWLAYYLINPQTMTESQIVGVEIGITLACLGLIAGVAWAIKRWSVRRNTALSR